MLVSVAICTYNGEKFVAKQLKSILEQSRVVDEIIICDDCSIDATISIVKKIINGCSVKVKLLQNSFNMGAIRSFEKCIKNCSGDVIFLSDQDDIWKSNKVEMFLKNFAVDKSTLAIFSNGDLINDKDELIGGTLWEKWCFISELQQKWSNNNFVFAELLFNRNVITGATLAFKRELLPLLLPFELPFGYWHDAWIGLIAAGLDGLKFIKESTIYYRVHQQQQVGVTTGASDKKFDYTDYAYFFAKLSKMFPDKKKVLYPKKGFIYFVNNFGLRVLSRLRKMSE